MLRTTLGSAALPLALLLAFAIPARASDNRWVWWEGEKPAKTNFPSDSSFASRTFSDARDGILSGGDWLTIDGRRDAGAPEAFATYDIQVPANGSYDLWARKFWKHGPFRWRFDKGLWQACGPDVALADNADIRQFLCVNWVSLGKAELTKGKHSFELRLLAKEGEETVACFDAFILTSGAFMPNGKLRPGEMSGLTEPGWFPYEPGLDPFAAGSPMDLRSLNEASAGEKGNVRREGARLVLGDGRPVRFWAVNVGTEMAAQNRTALDYMARKLAKSGVNMVRIHGPIFTGMKVDKKTLDNVQYLVSTLKRQGIYTSLSFYFPLWLDVDASMGIGGYDTIGNKRPFAIIYSNPTLQKYYRGWMKALLATKSPYSGLALGQDPAVAMTELVNEDSYFFWTFSKANLPAAQWSVLERLFGSWLVARYGSVDKALEAWGPKARLVQDNSSKGIAGVYEASDMTRDGARSGGADKTRRVGDQVRFLAETQRGFYEASIAYAREELGARCLFSCSNWTTADGPTLDAIERWTYTAGDVIDRHGYFNSKHEGSGSDYSVGVDHTYTSASALKAPDGLPLQVFQVKDYPHIISELGWTQPNRFRADWTFLSAAYGALQGIDGLYHFAVSSPFLLDSSIGKFQVCSPSVIGTFPATALMYRMGYVREGREVLHQVVRTDDLFAMKGTGTATASALDDLRKKDIPKGGEAVGAVTKFDALSFYVGPVVREYGSDPAMSTQANLPEYIDRPGKTVGSITGELSWKYGQGLATVNSPFSQGAVGFLGSAGSLDFGDVAIDCRNEYASVIAVSLDGLPLKESKRILLQAMTEDAPYGWRVEGKRIVSTGGAPFNVRLLDADVTLKVAGAGTRVVVLDLNGYPTAQRPEVVEGTGGSLVVKLPPSALYCVVERQGL